MSVIGHFFLILMDRKSSSASNESLSALYVKSMWDAVMRQRDAIIAEVAKEKPEIQIIITDALDAPFYVQNCQHPGKGHHVEKWWLFGSIMSRCQR